MRPETEGRTGKAIALSYSFLNVCVSFYTFYKIRIGTHNGLVLV
jgi:hypothetical protein